MKNIKNFIAGFIVLSVIASCKNEKSGEEDQGEKQETADHSAQVVLNMTVKKDDVFEVFYTEDGSVDFGAKSVRVDVKGKNESQQIVFDMPNNAKLTSLRVDVGQNPEQEEMTVDNMIVKQSDKEVEISGAEFFKYFNTTDYVVPTQGGSFKTQTVKGVYDPFVHNKGEFIAVLKGLQQ